MRNSTQLTRLFLLISAFLMSMGAMAQTITGAVTSAENNEALPGVNVVQKGTINGSVTDAKGEYSVRINAAKPAVLTFSSIGYVTKEITVTNQTSVSVKLDVDDRSLNEVVVIGYGTAKKADVTGAVASFDVKTIDQRPILRVDQALVGQMAGVQVKQTSGALGKGFSVQVRGSGSITAGNEPLYVIDGFPLATAAPNGSGNFATGNPLDNINPNDIESIQVLKDAASAAIYGSRAANGVVLITTKRGKQGRGTISINTYSGFMERTRKLDMLSAD
ncbi:MAG: TonB-dependent receptor, partial [Cytophagaceae bacterium]